MAEGIQNNILAKDVIAQPVLFDSNPKLALSGFNAFEFFNIKLPAQIIRVGLQDLFELFNFFENLLIFFALAPDILFKKGSDQNPV